MKIAIDYRLAAGSGRGMGRYCREIVARLMRLDPQNEYILYADSETGLPEELPPNFSVKLTGQHNYIVGEQWTLPRMLRRDRPDLFWAPSNTFPLFIPRRTGLIVTIHDLIFLKKISGSQRIIQRIGKAYRAWTIRLGRRRIDRFVTVSQYSAREIGQVLHAPEVTVTYNCADTFRERMKGSGLTANITDQPYFFTLSGDAPSKNLPFVIDLFSRDLPDETLVIAGVAADSPLREAAGERIVFLPAGIPDDELIGHYTRCKAFLFLSLYEGFGIPALEALTCGARVIASDRTSIPEIVGDCGLLVDPTDRAQCLEAIRSIDTFRPDPQAIERQIAPFYDWNRPAETMLKLFGDTFLEKSPNHV